MTVHMYRPKISIIIPAYNAANYLSQAIESALSQTYKNYEIIVVNDGSNDNGETKRIAESFGDRIIYIEKENGGSSSALNMGILNMSGDWFSWLSHDDLYYPYKLEDEIVCINSLISEGVKIDNLYRHIVFGAADLIDGNGSYIRKETTKRIKKTSEKINCPNGTLNLIAIPTQDGFHGCSCLVHKKAFIEVGMFDERLRLLNDVDLWFRFYTKNYIVHFVPKALVCGRLHSQQVSRSIGFSYHNEEQDMFWTRSFNWLHENYPDNYDLFYKFGKTALSKTRYKEGRKAFEVASCIDNNKRFRLAVEMYILTVLSKMKELVKQVYLKLTNMPKSKKYHIREQ